FGLAACSKNDETVKGPGVSAYHEYIIPKGAHYAAGNNFRILETRSLHFKARFDSSCIYTTTLPENASDINKLYGFSDCGSDHQENSARFGWLWNRRAIELYAYCYGEGRRTSKLLGTVDIGQEVELSLVAGQGKYVFTVNGKRDDSMKRSCSNEKDAAYQLFPYFGGDEVAPHDVRVYIKDL
ncbi:MAG TPA: hypothetical protein VEA37_09155, partial [Flavobacterium sp.]|nr:hypothetical protein [Flavobacterium sp.]